VVDGDTLNFGEIGVRLEGIDSPESRQVCLVEGSNACSPCGQKAIEELKRRIGSSEVRCEIEKKGRYGRWIGTCYANGRNLNAAMVQKGHAVAYRKYSKQYIPQEEEAKNAKRGIWSGKFVVPEKWRRGERLFECQ